MFNIEYINDVIGTVYTTPILPAKADIICSAIVSLFNISNNDKSEAINNNINVELNDADYVGIIEKIKNWIDEDRILVLKEKLKLETDINQKLKIADEIAKLKKRMCQNEESKIN